MTQKGHTFSLERQLSGWWLVVYCSFGPRFIMEDRNWSNMFWYICLSPANFESPGVFCPWPPPELNAEYLAGGISVASWDVQIKAIREELDIITFGFAFITLRNALLVLYLPSFDFSDLWIKSRLNYQSWKATVIKTLYQTPLNFTIFILKAYSEVI